MRLAIRLSSFLLLLSLCLTAQVSTGASPEALARGGGTVQAVLKDRLPKERLDAFLSQRIPGALLGNFKSYASMLYAVYGIPIWNDDPAVEKVKLGDWYPAGHKATRREVLDLVARQVGCTWSYNADTGYFVFKRGAQAYPFRLDLAAGWTARDQWDCIAFIPPIAPAGLDVYILGRVTTEDSTQLDETIRKANLHVSLKMAGNFKRGVREEDLRDVYLAGVKSLYFEHLISRPDGAQIMWRQWALTKNGQSFLIVSAIDKAQERQIFPDVQAMLKGFDAL